jgi:hypothetical protein
MMIRKALLVMYAEGARQVARRQRIRALTIGMHSNDRRTPMIWHDAIQRVQCVLYSARQLLKDLEDAVRTIGGHAILCVTTGAKYEVRGIGRLDYLPRDASFIQIITNALSPSTKPASPGTPPPSPPPTTHHLNYSHTCTAHVRT